MGSLVSKFLWALLTTAILLLTRTTASPEKLGELQELREIIAVSERACRVEKGTAIARRKS